MGSQPLDTDQHRQDASRGGSSSGGSPGHKKAKPQGAAKLPQGGVSGLEQGGGVEEAKRRLSAAKLIMEKDPSAKPWMLSRSISNSSLGSKGSAGKTRLRSVSRESSSDDSL